MEKEIASNSLYSFPPEKKTIFVHPLQTANFKLSSLSLSSIDPSLPEDCLAQGTELLRLTNGCLVPVEDKAHSGC
jgi:hypothetical protein